MFTFGSQLGYAARLVSISYFLWSVGEGLWLYIRPLYLENLGATPQQTGFALAMFGVGRVLPIFPIIALIDRVNPLRLMLPGWFCGLISVVLTALAPDWKIATVGIFIYGMSAVALIPANLYLALAFQHDPTRHPTTTLHTLFTFSWAAASAGLVISPVIGGFLGEQFGLRAVFAFSSLWFVLSTIIIWYCPSFPLSEPHPDGREIYRRQDIECRDNRDQFC